MRTTELQLVLVLLLIGWKNGASFSNQSLSVVSAKPITFRHSNENRSIPISVADLVYLPTLTLLGQKCWSHTYYLQYLPTGTCKCKKLSPHTFWKLYLSTCNLRTYIFSLNILSFIIMWPKDATELEKFNSFTTVIAFFLFFSLNLFVAC